MKAKKKTAIGQSADKINYPRLFLLLGGFFGLVMLTPPFQVPDEHDHFPRAVEWTMAINGNGKW